MTVIFRKNIKLWFLQKPYFIGFIVLAPLLLHYVNSNMSGSLTNRYGDPEFLMYLSFAGTLSALVFFSIWFFTKPKEIIVDFNRNEILQFNKSDPFTKDDCLLFISKSYDNLHWYDLIIKADGKITFKLPDGYKANIDYPTTLRFLLSNSRGFKLTHAHPIFDEKQSEEDKVLAEKGEGYFLSKD